MSRLLFTTGQNSTTQSPVHYAAITAGSTIRVWHTDSGALHINQNRFSLTKPTCLALTSTHQPQNQPQVKNQPILAIGTNNGLIHLINLNDGELIETLRQSQDPNKPKTSKALAVNDMIWSQDGSTLYSLSQKYVFVWQINKNFAQHKRLNIFGSLVTYNRQHQNAIHPDQQRLLNTHADSLRRIKLNYNQDKLILGASQGIYVYDLTLNTILTKYYGYMGKISTLTISEAPREYTQQQHHHHIQKRFENEFQHNDQNGKYTEFYIAAGTSSHNNVSIYKYPPPYDPNNAQPIIFKTKSSTQDENESISTTPQIDSTTTKNKKSNTMNDNDSNNNNNKKQQQQQQQQQQDSNDMTTVHFNLCGIETATCSLPAPPVSLNLTILYDSIALLPPQNPSNLTAEEKIAFTPILSTQLPHLMLSAATKEGAAVVFDINNEHSTKIQDDQQQQKKENKKSKTIQKQINTIIRLTTPKLTIHDPIISNYHTTLHRHETSTSEHEGKNITNRAAASNAGTTFKIKIIQEGAVNDIYFIDVNTLCVVRNSTLRPKIEVIQPTSAKEIPPLPIATTLTQPGDIGSCKERIQYTLRNWKPNIALPKLNISSNSDIELTRRQDRLLIAAVKNATTHGLNTSKILLGGDKQNSLSRVAVSSLEGFDQDDTDKPFDERGQSQGLLKKQRLLRHSSRLNNTLRHLLEENQDKIGLLTLAPKFNTNNDNNGAFNALAALQGTLCGVLVQALKSGDDSSLEHVIKLGVQGLNSQSGWSSLTKCLNNVDAMARIDNNNNKNNNVNSNSKQNEIATIAQNINIVNMKQIGIGKTLIQTVRLLPQVYILPFVNALTDKLIISPLRSFEILPWIHVILRLHSMYLLSIPDINQKLLQIGGLLRQRTNTMESVIQLKGRLEVILTQFSNTQQQGLRKNDKDKKDIALTKGFVPLNVYNERFDDVQDTIDDDGNDDDIDMFNMSKNNKKRGRKISNFSANGMSLDGIIDDDDDYDDENEDDYNDMSLDDWMGTGEGEYDNMDLFGLHNIGEGEYDDYDMNDDDLNTMNDDDIEQDDIDDEMFDGDDDDEDGDDGDSDDFDLSDDDL